MRLIAAGASTDGHYLAAVEIKLAGNAITYWREPGDAGVPPKFSIEGSENVASATVLFPAPTRIDEQGLTAFGYRGDVVFPMRLQARDAAKPIDVHLTVNYAVCDKICLPEKGRAELLFPREGEGPEAARITEANARVPAPLSSEEVSRAINVVADPSAAEPTWLLTWKGEGPVTDFFAEAPEGWAFETQRRADGRYALVAVQQPLSGAAPKVTVRLTVTGPATPRELMLELERPVKAPVPSGSKVGTQ